MHFYNNFRKECLRHGRFDDALPPVVLCGIVVAILHVSDRKAIGISPWLYPWIYPWIFPWISTKKSVDMDMDMDMDGKFHIHGKPGIWWNSVL